MAGAYLIIDHIVPASHLLPDSRLEEIHEPNASGRKSPVLDFHGVKTQVDLVTAVQKLLRLIRLRWLPVLQAFMDDKSLVELATRRYIRFLHLSCEQTKLSRSATYHNVTPAKAIDIASFSVPADDFTYVIWLCHMIDSWAYYNDCMSMCDGNIIDHQIVEDVDRYRLGSTASPYPFADDARSQLSIPMGQAVEWMYGMCRTFSLPHFSDSKFQHNAIKRYHCFLSLLRSYPSCFLTLPRPSDIMLAWMAHSLHPKIFRQDVRLMLGASSKVLLERVNVWSGVAQAVQGDPELLWRELFDTELLLPGTLHRPLLPHRSLSQCLNFPEAIKPSLILRLHFTDKTHLPSENWYVDLGGRELRPIQAGLIYDVPCYLDRFPLRVRVGNWPRVKWMVIGFIDLPFNAITTNTMMGQWDLVSWSGDYFRLLLHERPFGPRPLPPALARFVEVPAGQLANLVMLTSSLKIGQQGISVHFLPDLSTLFLFADDVAPLVVCKVVSSMFLPRPSQLSRPDIFPHMEEDSVGIIIHDRSGEQMLFVAHKDRKQPLVAVVLNPRLRWKDNARLPTCSKIVDNKIGFNGWEVKFSHEILFSPSFPMLLCLSLALNMFKISDQNVVQAFSASLANKGLKRLDGRRPNGVVKSKSSRSVHVNSAGTSGFDF